MNFLILSGSCNRQYEVLIKTRSTHWWGRIAIAIFGSAMLGGCVRTGYEPMESESDAGPGWVLGQALARAAVVTRSDRPCLRLARAIRVDGQRRVHCLSLRRRFELAPGHRQLSKDTLPERVPSGRSQSSVA